MGLSLDTRLLAAGLGRVSAWDIRLDGRWDPCSDVLVGGHSRVASAVVSLNDVAA